MGVFDFLFGSPEQTGQLDPQTKAARDFLLNQMLQQYNAGAVNVPQYQAVAPEAMYSGTNSLLDSLGLGNVSAPSMPTTTVGGIEAYSSQPFQEQIESSYAEAYPGQYDYLKSFMMDPVTGEFGTRSYGYNDPMAQVRQQVQNVNNGDSSTTGYMSQPNSTGNVSGSLSDGVNLRPVSRPTTTAQSSFGSDLMSSLSNSNYNPPGTVVSRAIDRLTNNAVKKINRLDPRG
tara:strand:+ start:74 stop:763 length:690 start_codon:yes stop_codon:yes gene_type:complete